MAKRFGRNQRRAMRGELAARNATIADLNRQNGEVHAWRARESLRAANLADRLERWARDVLRLMGEDSAFNERVRQMEVSPDFGDVLQLRPIMALPPVSRTMKPIPATTVQAVITTLIWRLHMSRDEFANMVRVELINRHGKSVGYALPERHLWTEADTEVLARHIAHAMGAYMEKRNG